MASSPITLWQIDGETVTDFIFLDSKITADCDRSHVVKRRLLLGRKVMTNLDSILESSSNCCFLTCIQISQEAGKMVWYSHLLKYFPQYFVIYTVKEFGIVNKAEVDVFLEFLSFFYGPKDAGNLISGSSAFSKSSLNIWTFSIHIRLKPGLENYEHYFAIM